MLLLQLFPTLLLLLVPELLTRLHLLRNLSDRLREQPSRLRWFFCLLFVCPFALAMKLAA